MMVLNAMLMAAFVLLVLLPLVVATVVMMRADSGQAPVSLGAFGPTLSGAFIGSLLGVFGALSLATVSPAASAGELAMLVAVATTLGLLVSYVLAPHSERVVVSEQHVRALPEMALEDMAA